MTTNKSKAGNGRNRRSLSIIALAVVALMTSCLIISCGGGDTETADTETTQAAAEAETKEETAESAEAMEETTEAAETSEATEVSTAAATKATEKATKAAEKATKAKKQDGSQEKSVSAKTEETETTKATEAANVCYISVEGYCSGKEIALKGGDTVYDILKRTGASVSAKNSANGLYIQGINGRFEFDEGPTSGWMYSVNGTEPNVSCGSYTVSKGDNISWYYVTD